MFPFRGSYEPKATSLNRDVYKKHILQNLFPLHNSLLLSSLATFTASPLKKTSALSLLAKTFRWPTCWPVVSIVRHDLEPSGSCYVTFLQFACQPRESGQLGSYWLIHGFKSKCWQHGFFNITIKHFILRHSIIARRWPTHGPSSWHMILGGEAVESATRSVLATDPAALSGGKRQATVIAEDDEKVIQRPRTTIKVYIDLSTPVSRTLLWGGPSQIHHFFPQLHCHPFDQILPTRFEGDSHLPPGWIRASSFACFDYLLSSCSPVDSGLESQWPRRKMRSHQSPMLDDLLCI